jgi:hypothetical protein
MLVGIIGHSGSGKDTVADYLVSKYKFVKISLADPLKRICKEVFDFSDTQLWGPSQERNKPDSRYKGLTPRKALQLLGTEWGRSVYEDVWIDYSLRITSRILVDHDLYDPKVGPIVRWWEDGNTAPTLRGITIPDVRFQNEVDKLKNAGGKLLKITRPSFDGSHAMLAGVKNHASEIEMDSIKGIDGEVLNKGTLEELYSCLTVLLESWYGPAMA